MQMYKKASTAAICLLVFAGCALFRKKPPETTLRVYEQASASLPEDSARLVDVPKTGLKIPVNSFSAFSENDVYKAELQQTPGGATILLRLDPSGKMQLDELTTRCRGRYIVTFINQHPVAAWLVDRRLTNGQFVIEGDLSDEDAKKIIDSLNRMSSERRAR